MDYTSFMLKITNHIFYYNYIRTYIHMFSVHIQNAIGTYVFTIVVHLYINIHRKLHIGDNRLIGTSKIHSCNMENTYVLK